MNAETSSPSKRKLRTGLILALTLISIIISGIFYSYPFQRFSGSGDEVTKIYFAEHITSGHREIIKRFNNIHENKIEVIPINLEYESFSTNKRKDLITRNLRSKRSKIDVFAVDQIWMQRFAKWAETLDNYVEQGELDQINSKALSTCLIGDSLYGLPLFLDVGVLYYREDMISKVQNGSEIIDIITDGITWDQLIQFDMGLKSRYLFQADAFEGLVCNFLEFLDSREAELFSKGYLLEFIQPEIEACKFMYDLIYLHKITPPIVTEFNDPACFRYALENNIPFFRGWPTAIKTIKLSSEQAEKTKYLRFAPLPKHKNDRSFSTLGGWNLMLSKYSENKSEAIKFIKFMISENAQETMYNMSGYLPIQKIFYSGSEKFEKYQNLEFFDKLIKNSVQRLNHHQYTKISDVLSKSINECLIEGSDIPEILNNAKTEISLILQNYQSMYK